MATEGSTNSSHLAACRAVELAHAFGSELYVAHAHCAVLVVRGE